MSETEDKVREYIADLDRQLDVVDMEMIETDDKVKTAALILKKEDLLKQRAVATGEKYNEFTPRKEV